MTPGKIGPALWMCRPAPRVIPLGDRIGTAPGGWLVFVFAFVCLLGIHRLIRLALAHRPKQTS